jgi:uncharacterized protein (TIGR03083 family)
MTATIPFPRMLELVDGRSAALRSALAGALDERVPGCPDWTGRDLIAHLGEVQRFWGAVVVAGKPDGPPEDGDVPETEPAGDLLDWSERSTAALLAALRDAGPDRPVWSWWGPTTSGRVARHQVQEAGVHAWDAEDTAGRDEPLRPADLAADGVAEFLSVEVPTNGGWPHPAATVRVVAADVPGDGWLVSLGSSGGSLTEGPGEADAELSGPAGELVLALYGRRKIDALSVGGDAEVARRFLGWFRTE